MFCTKCGKEIPNDSKVCGYCGAVVENDSPKPDSKFNITAALFPLFWTLVKGMWGFALVIAVVTVVLFFIPFGFFIRLAMQIAFVGRNANYYYWLKTTKNVSFLEAVRDVDLRRI